MSDRAHTGKQVKIVIAVIAAVLVWSFALLGIVLMVLNGQKDSPECQMAYEYLVSSEAFQAMDADTDDIFMNKYAAKTQLSPDGQFASRTVQIGFLVNFRPFTVVCHYADGQWTICRDCTRFH